MPTKSEITALRMERQFFNRKANEQDYTALYHDTQPGQNVYWHGFGDPPSITYRAAFDDIEWNRERQKKRVLIKGRFQGGNLGWIEAEDLELFVSVYKKPLAKPTFPQGEILELIEREGPLNIQQMKEATGFLVKEITPILHRLQEAFLIYEDQNDGEWDRGWYLFSEMFPSVDLQKYTKTEALKILLKRFVYRNVWVNVEMVKSFYKQPGKEIKTAVEELLEEGILQPFGGGFLLKKDFDLLQRDGENCAPQKSIFVMHRNDFYVKSNEYWLKEKYKQQGEEILQYLLIDGELRGAVLGKFKYGPYLLHAIVLDLPDAEKQSRKEEILEAVYQVNGREGGTIERYE